MVTLWATLKAATHFRWHGVYQTAASIRISYLKKDCYFNELLQVFE